MTEEIFASDSRNHRHFCRSVGCVWALYVLAAFWGVAQIVFPYNGALYYLFGLLFASTATLWARYDSMARGRPLLPVLQMLYFFVWPIGATLYLTIRSGWRGLLTGAMHGAGLTLLSSVTFYATFYGLHFAGLLGTPVALRVEEIASRRSSAIECPPERTGRPGDPQASRRRRALGPTNNR